ncbi:hypothetical protein GN956_G24677 [Arapaima gigas]
MSFSAAHFVRPFLQDSGSNLVDTRALKLGTESLGRASLRQEYRHPRDRHHEHDCIREQLWSALAMAVDKKESRWMRRM